MRQKYRVSHETLISFDNYLIIFQLFGISFTNLNSPETSFMKLNSHETSFMSSHLPRLFLLFTFSCWDFYLVIEKSLDSHLEGKRLKMKYLNLKSRFKIESVYQEERRKYVTFHE